MPFQYARFGGSIDWFDFTMTEEELIGKAACDSVTRTIDPAGAAAVAGELKRSVEQVKEIVFNQTQCYPVLIRFFSVPNFAAGKFHLCAAARSADGSVCIFGNDEQLLEYLTPEGYALKYLNKGE